MPFEDMGDWGGFRVRANFGDVLEAFDALDADLGEVIEAIQDEGREELLKRSEPIVRYWENPGGRFVAEVHARKERPRRLELRLYGDWLVTLLNYGTRAHEIVPRQAKALRFIWGGPGSYTAKTQPRMLGSGMGGPTGVETFRVRVWHPGFPGRRWLEMLATDARHWFPELVDKWLRWALEQLPSGMGD